MAKAKKQETRVGYETFRENMGFSEALNFLKEGHLIAREGWNGKGMYLYQVDGDLVKLETKNAGWTVEVLPFIVMRTASGALQPGWNPSQSDVLAHDWVGLNLSPMEYMYVSVTVVEDPDEIEDETQSAYDAENQIIAAAILGSNTKNENLLKEIDFLRTKYTQLS